MAGTAELNIAVRARNEATGVLKDLNKELSGSKKLFGELKGVISGVGLSALVGGLSSAANAAATEEANIARLTNALDNVGVAYSEVEGDLEGYISRLGKMGIADDKARDALANLTQVTGDYTEAMKLMPLAMDLARAKNMDFEQAAQLVGRVSEGNTEILKRYGIVLGKGATAAEALAAMQQKFGGAAEAYGNTAKGTIDSLSVSFGNFKESIGGALGGAMPFVAMLPGMSTGFSAIGGAAGGVVGALGKAGGSAGMIGSFGGLLGAMGPILPIVLGISLAVAAGILIWKYHEEILWALGKAYEWLKGIFWSILDWLRGNWPLLVSIIGGPLGAVAVQIYQHWDDIKQTFWDIVTLVLDFLRDNWPLIVSILGGPLAAAGIQIYQHWEDIKGFFTKAVNVALGFLRDNWPLIVTILGGPLVAAGIQIWQHWEDIKGFFMAAWTWVSGTFSALWNGISTIIAVPIEIARDLIKGAIEAILGFFQGLIDKAKEVLSWIDKIPSIGDIGKGILKVLPGFQAGGIMTSSGLAIVGEAGPELVHLPGGSRVYSNAQSQGLGAKSLTVNVNISTGDLVASDPSALADEIAWQVSAVIGQQAATLAAFGVK